MKDNNKPIGLITYHAAYNFGSVLQAYGTVKTLENLGYAVETINYRTASQTFWYHTDFSIKKGIRGMIDNFGFQFIPSKRKKRASKFEEFISKYLNQTETLFTSNDDIQATNFKYDILISGSDQVWNIDCGEFTNEPFEAILPYFLQFGNPNKRIAYASSFGGQTLRNIRKYKDLLLSYDFLSTREPIIREYIERVIGQKVNLVCDPTWLLTKKQWNNLPLYNPQTRKQYIFVYVLYWDFRALRKWLKEVKALANRLNFDIYCISPLNYHNDTEIHMLQDAGPIDFLSYLNNAQLVITNTFHGTIFSMNFEIPFYSCNVTSGSRQSQMLTLCGLEDRIINSANEFNEITDYNCDFSYSSEIIAKFRKESIEYLKKALQE